MIKNKKTFAIIIFVITLVVMAAVCVLVGIPLVRLASSPQEFRGFIDSFGIFGSLIFTLLVAFQVVFAFVPGEPLEVLGGYAFGFWEGSILCILGAAIGSVIIFLFTRKFGKKFVTLFVSEEKLESIKILNDKKRVFILTFILFLIPGSPKDLLTYVSGLTSIKLWQWLIITSIARIPSVVTSTMSGHALNNQDYLIAIIVFGVTAIISVTGMLIYKKITNNKQNK